MKKKPIKIAYLLLCHKNPEQVNLLTQELCKKKDSVYIHWNQKTYQTCVPKLFPNEQIHILPYPESYPVSWGDFSICLAQLQLIRTALKEDYDYFFSVSGQDFPIVSQEEIHRLLEEAEGNDFIDVIQKDSPYYQVFSKRNQVFHPRFMIGTNLFSTLTRHLWYFVTGGKYKTFPCFFKESPFETLYYGSNWWCLSKDTLTKMIAYYDKCPNIQTFFSSSVCSDECLFQSLFMASSHQKKRQNNLTYIDWSEGKNHPKTLTIRDFETLIQNPYHKCMARKFDKNTDENILFRLQETINLPMEEP